MLPALIRRFHGATAVNAPSVTCWGTGTPLREFLHVDDLGEACVFVLRKWKPENKDVPILNVGSGIDVSIRNLADSVAKATLFNGKITWDSSKPDGTPRKLLDVSRIKDLGWASKISLEDGIKDTVALYQEQLANNLIRL